MLTVTKKKTAYFQLLLLFFLLVTNYDAKYVNFCISGRNEFIVHCIVSCCYIAAVLFHFLNIRTPSLCFLVITYGQ